MVSRYFWDKHKKRHRYDNFNVWLQQHYSKWRRWKKDELHLYTHVKGQYVLDFVGRYENLDHDFNLLCQKLKLPDNLTLGTNKQVQLNKQHYSYYYDEKSKLIVAKLFQKDIEYFNYTFEN